ncbi:zinc finger protein [Hyphodiscus hymeniophilus]|uniref:Zinc finger protein n=1 Tax=Hyphodiscus hymeniophilus TaxID=353542 RepID=A0A9P6VPH1_9HELO|nr:zinc finger protein [Hyphodiscus hymeniophilus]
MEAQSFTARRSAANNLPTFQLPPPDHLSAMHKYPAYAPTTSTQPTAPIVSSVLTPPAGLPSDGLSPLSSVNSGSSGSSAAGVPPYQGPAMGYWPTPQNPSYAYSSAPPMPAPFAHQQNSQQNYMGRQLYSPSMNFSNRNTNPQTAGEGLPPPPYDLNLPPFPTAMSMSGSSGGQQHHLPTLAPHQQQQQQQQQMNGSQAPPQGPHHAPDYGGRPPPTPTYYTPSSTPQQSSFPAYTQQSPTQQSPSTSQAQSNRISPVSAQSHAQMAAPQGYGSRPPYGGYSLPAMSGPIMSNVHNPNNSMALVGGVNMGYPQHQMGGPMYGQHPGQQQQQNDRPFKCDQCPQSFNRNHDLKRHKRIHLAVKPFPCGHCEKSFSRKDALKRHILVKGCGKSPTNGTSNPNGGSQSPVDKSEVMSDSTDGSPEMMKKEL